MGGEIDTEYKDVGQGTTPGTSLGMSPAGRYVPWLYLMT